jgi:hypothetical protein
LITAARSQNTPLRAPRVSADEERSHSQETNGAQQHVDGAETLVELPATDKATQRSQNIQRGLGWRGEQGAQFVVKELGHLSALDE